MTNKVEAPPIGTVLAGKYRLDRRVGKGGMGVVFEAQHLLLETPVAIKVLTDREPSTVTRFLNEARAAARLKSDYVVTVSDVGTDDGTPYMVMELLEGEDLGHMASRRGALPSEEVCDYMVQALAGLAEAHALGIVHRDLKPGNLFVTWRGGHPDRVKILDFGISKRLFDEGGPNVTTGSSVLGSPAYMAPEQLRGERSVDGRTDIWAVGVILYELLTGQLPFNGPNAGAVFAAILENDPVAPAMLRAEVPMGLDEIVLKCLQRKPDDRYGTAGEVADALAPFCSEVGQRTLELLRKKVPGFGVAMWEPARVKAASLSDQSVPPQPSVQPEQEPQGSRRRGWILGVFAVVLVSVIGVGIGVAVRGVTSAPATPPPVSPPVITSAEPSASAAVSAPSASAPRADVSADASAATKASSASSHKPPTVRSAKTIDEDAIFRRH